MNRPDISIIIPVYNVEPYLERCLASIDLQRRDGLNTEVIIVDDGSTDNSGLIADRYKMSHPDTKVIHTGNKGLSAARNRGMELATGDWISFVDSDDALYPDTLTRLLKSAVESNADIAQASWINIRGNRKKTVTVPGNSAIECVSGKTALKHTLDFKLPSYVPGRLYRHNLIKDIRFEEGVCFEDIVWMTKVLSECKRYIIARFPHYAYFYRKESISGHISTKTLDFLNGLEWRFKFVQQRFPDLEESAIRQLWFFAYDLSREARVEKADCYPAFVEAYNRICADYRREINQHVSSLTVYRAAMKGPFVYSLYNLTAPYLAPVKQSLKRFLTKEKKRDGKV